MGCGCKKTNSIPEKILGNTSKNKIVGFLLFLVVSVLSVFLYPIILLILFKHIKYFLLSLLLIAANGFLNAQETLAVGQVLNALDKSPIPDVNIFFKN